ncbi:hypothetical protein N7517_005096 [Penicillium concentricum]|uniref:Zn(2)-C6 fungal-type domain-containing protein n=1 Tax=Penicillium concentricum TaxID=293559 RepID=A0A9W9VB50_9EURO|nr:uncharacterized protein N7517_005096 [Penicillium concentricum]KAJ5373090.1 hypothetical protein N7517_005096 [Penicillium concentricum]
MVGVPGRSKACRTCRRRKKGCDLQQPSCGQCRKSSIPCEGYAEGLTIYRYYDPGHKGEVPSSGSLCGTQSRLPIEASPNYPSLSAMLATSVTLSQTAHESCLEGNFWTSYMPNGHSFSLFSQTQRDLGGSISVLRDILLEKSILRTALGAMALTTAANKVSSQYWMRQQGTNLHVSALRQMRKALSSPRKPGLELLGAARVFSLYEFIQALYGGDCRNQEAQSRNWMIHHSGDLALILSNSPSFYATGPAHRLFVDGRLNHAQFALKERKKHVFSEPMWMTDPWIHHPKTRKDLLVDILLELPSIYEGIDNMNIQPDSPAKLRQRLILKEMGFAVMEKLYHWSSKFAITVACIGPKWQLPINMTTDEIADTHIMTIYWASSIIAYSRTVVAV